MWILRQRLTLSPSKAIYIFINRTLPQSRLVTIYCNLETHPTPLLTPHRSALLGELYSQYKDDDGFIYILYSGENTFGWDSRQPTSDTTSILDQLTKLIIHVLSLTTSDLNKFKSDFIPVNLDERDLSVYQDLHHLLSDVTCFVNWFRKPRCNQQDVRPRINCGVSPKVMCWLSFGRRKRVEWSEGGSDLS